MIEFKSLWKDIRKGFKIMAIAFAWLAIFASVIWGIVSAILVLTGKLQFSLWLLPCWILILITIAGAIGAGAD